MKRRNFELPSGPTGSFLIGNLVEFIREPLTFLTRCNREFGDITSISLPTGRAYLVAGPELIEQILVTKQRNFAKPRFYDVFKRLLGNGLALSNGDFWLRQRRLTQPAFHRQKIHAYGEVMVKYATRLMNKWQDNQVYDLVEAMHHLSMESITKVLFDADISSTSDTLGKQFKITLGELQTRLLNPFQIPSFIPTPRNLRYKKTIKSLDNLIYNIADERRASGKDTGDLLSMFLRTQYEDGTQMTNVQLRDEMLTLILGGHESTANGLAWVWYLLSQHPQVEEQLWEELAKVLGDRLPTASDIPNLPYTEKIVKETLRLYPPVWFFGREAINDCEIEGHFIPAGQQIFLSPWAVQRNPRFFPEPDQFIPERWATEEIKDIPKFAYFPFGGGPRVCIGQALAMMETILIVATIAQKYQLVLEPGQTIEPQPLVTVRPKNGLKMRVVARKPTLAQVAAAANAAFAKEQEEDRELAGVN